MSALRRRGRSSPGWCVVDVDGFPHQPPPSPRSVSHHFVPDPLHRQACNPAMLAQKPKPVERWRTHILTVPLGPRLDLRTSWRPSPALMLTLRASPRLCRRQDRVSIHFWVSTRSWQAYPRLGLGVEELRSRHDVLTGRNKRLDRFVIRAVRGCCAGWEEAPFRRPTFFSNLLSRRSVQVVSIWRRRRQRQAGGQAAGRLEGGAVPHLGKLGPCPGHHSHHRSGLAFQRLR